MLKPPDLDRDAVRRQFDRRARTIGDADFLLREVEHRMLERLEPVRLAPSMLVDVGCGIGQGISALMQRYAGARALGIDSSPAMLGAASQLRRRTESVSRRLQRLLSIGAPGAQDPLWCAADAARLPLARSSADLLWSNLAWHWLADPVAVAAEWYRVLRPQGLLMFSALGVDSLKELRGLGAMLPEFPDLHDIGDLLGQTGFADPVLDTERLNVTWRDPARLLADLHRLGGNALRGRCRGLATPRQRDGWLRTVDGLRGADGQISISFEIVFAHAWCPPQKRLPDGATAVRWVPKTHLKR